MTLEYRTEGDPTHPTLALIHRGGALHRMWQPQIDALAGRYHLILPDLFYPGEWGDFTVKRAADDVRAIITEATDGPVVLAGVALGAAVATQIALDAPDAVRGLVLVGPRVRVAPGAMRVSRTLMRLMPRKMVETQHVKQARRTTDLSDKAEQELYRLGRPGLLAASRAMEGVDFSDALPRLNVPTLVVVGAHAGEVAVEA
ncbi:MAG: alpha/beta hydrolase, partial [Chloroflexota bacterium]